MTYITLGLFSIILIGILMYYFIRNHDVNKVSKAMKEKRYQDVLTLCDNKSMKRFLSPYVCDLYRIRAYSFMKDDKKFKEVIDEVLEKDYPIDKQKELLELYFHYFLLKDDREYAGKLLEDINAIGEPAFYTYNEQAFDVMMNKTTDLIAVIEDEINSKQFSGFALGVLVYMMGKQYLVLGDKEEARTYFYNSLACFHKNAIYVNSAKKYVKELSDELGLEMPNY